MKITFTLNDLLRYHYNEFSEPECRAIEHQMTYDEELRQESNRIIRMKQVLNGEYRKPSPSSIQLILDHDRQSSGELEPC